VVKSREGRIQDRARTERDLCLHEGAEPLDIAPGTPLGTSAVKDPMQDRRANCICSPRIARSHEGHALGLEPGSTMTNGWSRDGAGENGTSSPKIQGGAQQVIVPENIPS